MKTSPMTNPGMDEPAEFQSVLQCAEFHSQHIWLLDNEQVAIGFGTQAKHIRTTKSNHSDELEENVHWISRPLPHGGSEKTFWTKLGVICLGFFLRSDRAKAFRKAASQYLVRVLPDTTEYATAASSPTDVVVSNYLEDLEGVSAASSSTDTVLSPYLESLAAQVAQPATMALLTKHIPDQIILNLHRIYSGGATPEEQQMLNASHRSISGLMVFETVNQSLNAVFAGSRQPLQEQES